VSVTNVCNAACDFCGFSRTKNLAGPARYLDPRRFAQALPILRRRHIRYLTFQGGEPLVHPHIDFLVSEATRAGISCGLITNGWFLAQHIGALAACGLKRLHISIDSDSMIKHEMNRGLRGLKERIAAGIAQARACGIVPNACVTVNRLVNYEGLPEALTKLGFDAVTFSYPRREKFGSSSLVYGDDSALVDFQRDELLAALDAIKRLKKRFRVLNPSAALEEVERFVRDEEQTIPCVGGYKYFYLDWNLQIWRCEAWSTPLGSVFDLDRIPDQREPCQACMMACYRHASLMMHGPIALTESLQALFRGDFAAAAESLSRKGIGLSLRTLMSEHWPRRALRPRKRPDRAPTSAPPVGLKVPLKVKRHWRPST
jgi:MoaA/NifB/PqqE/SkfB family radical SAM enzyme